MPQDPAWRASLRACRACHAHGGGLVHVKDGEPAFPLFHEEGNLSARLLFVIEAPNFADTYDPNKRRLTVDPETDPSGRYFHERLASDLGLRPEDVLVTNAVLCLPARRDGKHPVSSKQRELCAPNLRSIIENINPWIVAPQGNQALSALARIERHGLVLKRDVAQEHAWFGRVLFPLYHPSFLGRVTRRDAQQIADYRSLRAALERLA